MTAAWSLVVTVPHRERAVARMLNSLDCPFHLFQELRQHVWRGRIIERPHPIFPGYIFVLLQGLLWERVRSIIGVLGFVTVGERVATVDHNVVSGLIEASVNDVLPLQVAPPVTRFRPGDRVCVGGTGVMIGQVGVFQRMLVGTQALIDVEWMGRWVPIAVDERDLEFDTVRRARRHRRRRPSDRDATLNSAIA